MLNVFVPVKEPPLHSVIDLTNDVSPVSEAAVCVTDSMYLGPSEVTVLALSVTSLIASVLNVVVPLSEADLIASVLNENVGFVAVSVANDADFIASVLNDVVPPRAAAVTPVTTVTLSP